MTFYWHMVALQCCINFFCIKGVLNTVKRNMCSPPIQVPYLQIWKADSTSPFYIRHLKHMPILESAEGWECPGTNPPWVLRDDSI